MRVLIQRSFGGFDAFDVWFVLDDAIARRRSIGHFVPEKGGPARLEWKEVAENESSEPTLRLSGFEAAMLKRGFDEHGPTTSDGLELAKDAIKVRDRLLALVERLAGAAA